MSKVAIVYWSGTGNTEAMAKAIEEGAKGAGGDVSLFEVESFKASSVPDYDGLIFGCPAMGDEVLEEGSFEPLFTDAEKSLSGKPVALFGSYGWGGGAWMESWAERTRGDGAKLFSDGLIVENAPGDAELADCRQLGENFVKSL
ncbi:flavodoxin, short chain [Selenomonas ruminantium]|uniref:Flavodoxin n=1 Tax=Selenomonas ruminantium TaxID=971 RepID=A0A1M6T5Q1_SELRU|nr:flavodoxin [Selenomonas ruminantium]SHK52295.1 flavodoxin, short chain [Selenomonas ruminantium]